MTCGWQVVTGPYGDRARASSTNITQSLQQTSQPANQINRQTNLSISQSVNQHIISHHHPTIQLASQTNTKLSSIQLSWSTVKSNRHPNLPTTQFHQPVRQPINYSINLTTTHPSNHSPIYSTQPNNRLINKLISVNQSATCSYYYCQHVTHTYNPNR